MVHVQVGSADVLKALKKFKRLAKQDILASRLTTDPEFWRKQAEARRQVYEDLMRHTEEEGAAKAYEVAEQAYAKLPLHRVHAGMMSPQESGQQQAFELFFGILGITPPNSGRARAGGAAGTGEPEAPSAAVMSNA